MVDIICSRCKVFITTAPELPPETLFCGNCIVDILQAKLRLADDVARTVRQNYDAEWKMPQSVITALKKYEEATGGPKRN